MAAYDPVDKPYHYNVHPSGIQCIEVTRHMNFCLGNAVKYLWRAGLKPIDPLDGPGIADAVQDLQKAVWYIEDEIARLAPDLMPPDDCSDCLARVSAGSEQFLIDLGQAARDHEEARGKVSDAGQMIDQEMFESIKATYQAETPEPPRDAKGGEVTYQRKTDEEYAAERQALIDKLNRDLA